MACRLDPRTGFQMAGEWLKYQLTAPVDTGPMNCKLSEKKNDLVCNSSQDGLGALRSHAEGSLACSAESGHTALPFPFCELFVTKVLGSAEMLWCGSLSAWCCV